MSIATITTKGQITLPKDVRVKLHLDAGEKIEFRVDEKRGTATVIPINRRVDDLFGILRKKNRTGCLTIGEMDEKLQQQISKDYK